MVTFPNVSVVDNRYVLTYCPGRWPVGLVTGFERDGGFYLEHVVTFPGANAGDLVGLLSHAFREGIKRGYTFVTLCIAVEQPNSRKLESVARWFGFIKYREEAGIRHYAMHYKEPHANHTDA